MLPQTYSKETNIRIGVLLAPPPVQLLDLAPADLFHMLSKEYLGVIEFLPKPIKDLAINQMEILYVADREESNVTTFQDMSTTPTTTGGKTPTVPVNTLSLAPLTGNITVQITADLDDPKVQPGNLTILVLPGPDPSSTPSQRTKKFISSHAACGKTDIITICTGIFPACYAGICDNKTVTGPRGLTSQLTKKFPGVKSFEDKRWTCDILAPSSPSSSSSLSDKKSHIEPKSARGMRHSELWTSAGITNGHDCIAAYIRAHFVSELGDVVLRMADVSQRSQSYDVGQTAEGFWWISRILSALVKGVWRG